MALIEFLSTGKYIEDQKFGSSGKYSHQRSFVAIVVFLLGETSSRDFAQLWVDRNDMRTKIHPLWQHGKSRWIHDFPKQPKGLPIFYSFLALRLGPPQIRLHPDIPLSRLDEREESCGLPVTWSRELNALLLARGLFAFRVSRKPKELISENASSSLVFQVIPTHMASNFRRKRHWLDFVIMPMREN
jgi:hypothetical protein